MSSLPPIVIIVIVCHSHILKHIAMLRLFFVSNSKQHFHTGPILTEVDQLSQKEVTTLGENNNLFIEHCMMQKEGN